MPWAIAPSGKLTRALGIAAAALTRLPVAHALSDAKTERTTDQKRN